MNRKGWESIKCKQLLDSTLLRNAAFTKYFISSNLLKTETGTQLWHENIHPSQLVKEGSSGSILVPFGQRFTDFGHI